MLRRAFIVVGAGALAALYSCSDSAVRTVQRAVIASTDGSSVGGDEYGDGTPDAGTGGSDAGSGGSDAGSGGSDAGSGGSDAGSGGSDAGSGGSDAGTQIRFRVWHSASNMRDASAANAHFDRQFADDLGGLGSLGYGGCAFDQPTVTRSIYSTLVSIFYSGDSTSGSFSTPLAQGSASAEIVCASGPIPPPDTGAGSDTSSPGPESAPILDPPPAP